jgi:uroporphyrinogen-III synthase
MGMPEVLSTKELEPHLLEKAKAAGIHIYERAFISVQPVGQVAVSISNERAGSKELNVAFTSANAVKYGAESLNNVSDDMTVKVFCLTGKTKTAVEEHFQNVSIAGLATDAASLADVIISSKVKEIIFFCGDKRMDELPGRLKEAGIKISEAVVYRTLETPVQINDEPEAILFFSPSAVESFFSINQTAANTVCFAIGTTTAEKISAHGIHNIIISPEPTQEQMIEEVINHFSEKKR